MKQFNVLLRTALLLLLLPAASSMNAQYSGSEFCTDGIYYRVVDYLKVKVCQPTYGNTTYSGDIVIPGTVSGGMYSDSGSEYHESIFTVVGIDDYAFSDCADLTSVVLPGTVTEIGNAAFYQCYNLTSVIIPNSVKTIGEQAFGSCSSLTSIFIPSSVTQMGWKVFYNCSSLTDVTLSRSVSELNGTFFYCTALQHVEIPASVRALDGTFQGCSSLQEVDIPNSVTYIGGSTFWDCTSLTSVVIPSTVTSIGNQAFYNCNNLASISVRNTEPPTMNSRYCFGNLTYTNALLTVPQLSLPTYKETDWWNLFQNIEGDERMNNNYDFEAGGIYYIITGENTVSVTYKDDNYNSYSTNVTIPLTVNYGRKTYNVTAIGVNAFRDCIGLTEVTIPASIGQIGANAFTGCTSVNTLNWNATRCWSTGNLPWDNITSVSIGNNVEVIPNSFAKNVPLTSIDIPASVTAIGDSAFADCSGITTLTIPEAVKTIGELAFLRCYGIKTLNWNPQCCYSKGAMPTTQITQVTVGDNVQVIPSYFAYGSNISSIDLPDAVTTIGNDAFYDCFNLAIATLPPNLETIGNNAFRSCWSLTSLNIPVGVTHIGEDAFMGTSGLETLTWNARECLTSGSLFTWEESLITQATIGDEVRVLPGWFLHHTKITSIDIPASLTQLPPGFCAYCPNLNQVYIPKTVTAIGETDSYSQYYSYYWLPFAYCNALESIVVEEGNPIVDSRDNCNALILTSENKILLGCNNTVIPSTVTAIGENAFQNCKGLTTIDTKNVTTIGYDAFWCCDGLTTLIVGPALQTFDYCSITDCPNLASIVVDSDNPYFDSRNNCNAIIGTANDGLIVGSSSTVIPNGIKTINYYAFRQRNGVTSITIPNTVTTIGYNAFYNCPDLTEVIIGTGVQTIDYGAFSDCFNIANLTCLATTPPTVRYNTFNGITSTATLHVPLVALEAYQTAQYWKNFANIQAITPEPGDLDGDSELSVNDVVTLIDMILSGETIDNPAADVNGDGEIDINDITMLIDIILNA